MVQVNEGNVLLKPSHRKRLTGWLRRIERLGGQIGNFALKIQFHRKGRRGRVEVEAMVQDAAGSFSCRAHDRNSMNACRQLITRLAAQMHDRRVNLAT